MKKTFFVYILSCSDNTYYTGVTSNLENRLQQHQSGYDKSAYTYFRRPVQLEYFAIFTDSMIAFQFQQQIKKWSQKKKQALINGEYEKLPNLAKKKFNK